MRQIKYFIYMFLLVSFFSISCGKDPLVEEVVLDKSELDESFFKGAFVGGYGGVTTTFDFKDNNKFDLTVGGGLIKVSDGHFDIIKKGADTEMIIISGQLKKEHIKLLVGALPLDDTSKYNVSGIVSSVAKDLKANSSDCIFAKGGNFLAFMGPTTGTSVTPTCTTSSTILGNRIKLGNSGSETEFVVFPILVEDGLKKGDKKIALLNFVPGWAFFGKTEIDAKTAMKNHSDFKTLDIATKKITEIPIFGSIATRYETE